MEDNLKFKFQLFSKVLLVRLISSDIPRISHLACLTLEIAMKKTLNMKFDDPMINSEGNFCEFIDLKISI